MSATMRAAVHVGGGIDGIRLERLPVPAPAAGEALVRLGHAALNRHDLFVIDARAEAAAPLILGSDGHGVLEAIDGAPEGAPRVGEAVIVNPCLGWPDPDELPQVPEVLGDPRDGTLAEYVKVPAANVHRAPAHLDPVAAASLGLAGMTAYRVLFTQGELRAGMHVLIPGIGGGVALMALLFAKAVGARVTVTSRSAEVLARAAGHGADQLLRHDDDWTRQRLGPVDLVVDSLGSAAYERAIALLRPGGVFVSFGATTAAEVTLDLRDLFFRQVAIKGSSMASEPEFEAMLRFVAEHELVPPVGAVYPLSETAAALEDLRVGRSAGKVAVEIAR